MKGRSNGRSVGVRERRRRERIMGGTERGKDECEGMRERERGREE